MSTLPASSEAKSETADRSSAGRFPRARLWIRRITGFVVALPLLYLACAVFGLIPVNRGFKPTEDGVQIFVYSGSVHSDIIVPAEHSVVNWREFFPATHFGRNPSWATHVSIGWGDRGFYLETPEWKDLTVATAAHAMLIPSKSVMHVEYACPKSSADCKPVTISNDQYRRLVEFIARSFAREADGGIAHVKFAYGRNDAFYDARDSYHAFRTCNCWVGGGLRYAGVRTGGFTPFPRTVLWYLPD